MIKKRLKRALQAFAVTGLAAATLLSNFSSVSEEVVASSYDASYIRVLDDVKVDYTEHLNNSVFYKLNEGISDDTDLSVIITLSTENLYDAYEKTDKKISLLDFVTKSDKAAETDAKIAEEKAEVLSAIDKLGIAYTTGENYNTLLSGFEIVIKAGDFEAVCKSLGKGRDAIVGEVYKPCDTKLVENTVNVYDTGIFNSEGCGYDGSGMVVAVLDTGLDSGHSAFSVENFTSKKLGLTYDDVAKVLKDTKAAGLREGLSVDDVYINEKVPFGFDYADSDPDVYSTHNEHGTHVSGVIVGKDDTITGVAPNAQLVSMKIFSDVMDTARSAWILSALEDCVVLGVDVINMSLGTACGFSRESDKDHEDEVYDKIRKAGISVIAAASNSYSSAYGSEANGNLGLTANPDTSTVGSPSTYKGVISVASIKGVETPYIKYGETIIYFDESNNGAAIENKFFETLLGDEKSIEIEFVTVPGIGRSADYTGLDVKGKIALVRRGDTTFEEKAFVAQKQGAAGIIIYNNVSGDIKMNVGDATLAVCSISQNDGEMLAAVGSGMLSISVEQTSGPFMSDFSSWGPSPDLGIKPEITAHGGDILSAVTGGGYDRLSGTSMACPNLAGVAILLRQYVVENFPSIADDNAKVTAMVNRLMMSTADIAINTNGVPYAVRKQGAGLANLLNSVTTPAYITTFDETGAEMDTTKLELGDDPEKNGVYEMHFSVNNIGDKALSYDIGAYVMTEGVSETKTNAGKTTITEEAYILDGAVLDISVIEGGTLNGTKLTVGAGETADVKVVITLSDSDKKYLDESFENGMYVEGFITLKANEGTEISLNVPYLAFYGDWTTAPMFDLDYFATHADELDDAIPFEDKTMADAYATRPIGGVYDDYVSYLGTYYFIQNPDDIVISANRDYIALSNQEGTIHSLRFVWAGLLRNAAKIEISITDDITGEVVFECVDDDVRKSYGDGGSIYPANIEIEFDTQDYNLANNSEYTVKLVGYMDYGDGALTTNKNNTFEFPLTVDFEAPTLKDVEFYYEYDNTEKINRLYAKAAIYDNHFAMAAQLGYVVSDEDEEGNETSLLKSFEQYLTPIYSKRNDTTYVTFELTDYIYELKDSSLINRKTFVLTCYDYALNIASYEVGLPDDYVDFLFEGFENGLTMSPNEVFKLEPLSYPDSEWVELLEFTSQKTSVAKIVNNKIVAVAPGVTQIMARDPESGKSVKFTLTVLGEGDEGYMRYDKPVADIFRLDGYDTIKAYYVVDNDEKDIGDTGDTRFFEGNYNLSMYPSESVLLNYTLDAYFPKDTQVVFESGNESIVTVNEGGLVTAVSEGLASVTIKLTMDGRSTYYSQTVTVEVKDPYIATGGSLTHYYGNGGAVVIPTDLSLKEIGSFAFSNFEYVLKTEEELAFDDAETSKMWYIGDATITKVVIPEGVKKINSYAFASLTALEEVVFPSTLEAVEYGAFYGCTSLKKISFSSENNLKIINQNAFESCNLQGTIKLDSICIVSDYAFAGNKELKGIEMADTLLSIGQYAFAGCKNLSEVTIGASKVKYGAYAFTDCEALTEFYVNAAVLPEGMFYECENMTKVTVGPEVNDIGEFAFRDTKIESFVVSEGNKAYKVQTNSYILSADGSTLVAVAPTFEGEFSYDDIGGAKVSVVADGAFSHNKTITDIKLSAVTAVGDYAFASNPVLVSVSLGKLDSIGEYAFFETAITELPEFTAKTSIGKYAFAHSAVTNVRIPDGMTVEEGVFSELFKLEEVVIGDNVTLGKYAFNASKDYVFTVDYYIDGEDRMYYYVFSTSLKTLTIGENAVIGENAFANAASLESVTLGKGAKIGYMAFYNNCSLKDIDLSGAVEIGDYAFSGDVYYVCYDENMTVAAVDSEGHYVYDYHGLALESIDLSSAESIGANAFSYCRQLKSVVLGEKITVIPEYAFAGCIALEEIDLSRIVTVDGYAFTETALTSANLSAAETVGDYAFVYCNALESVSFNKNGVDVGEGAFSYCEVLATVSNLKYVRNIGDYAFAYNAIVKADISGAESLGKHAFMKEELTEFDVTIGNALTRVGDNPFAMCKIDAFKITEKESFNGTDYSVDVYTYDISDTVKIIDGSIYCVTDKGLILCTYAGEGDFAKVADGTVRVSSMAFAYSDVKTVSLPYTVRAIGHKAFFGCDKLDTVVFSSFEAPILEEEFDPTYYECFENLPGSGNFGTYTDYDGNEVEIFGTGLIPYYMWNSTDGMYSNVFYGASFVNYVGKVENKLTMIRPVNGLYYDSYILGQYFDTFMDGASAADDTTLEAIDAINKLPEQVKYTDKALVEAARAAYNKVATTEQQALVSNYPALVSAEQRITALTPNDEVSGGEESEESGENSSDAEGDNNKASDFSMTPVWISIGALAVVALITAIISTAKGKKKNTEADDGAEKE
ncbi:MAG: leucine-rich repeat protein [Clostridia bacterium]|nr:leucine-rich repeat protein [Clostridia bacterium]